MQFYEIRHDNEEHAKQTLARINHLLSAENSERLKLYIALKSSQMAQEMA